MVITKVLTTTGGKWLNGKWVKSVVETVTDTVSRSHVAEEGIAKSKALINFKTKPLTTDILEIGTKTSTIDIVKSFGLKSAPKGFVFELSPEIEQQILTDYGHSETAMKIISRLRKPLTQKDVENIENILSKSSGIVDITTISPYRIVNLYKTMKINCGKDIDRLLADLTPDKATIILNGARGQSISKAQMEAISRFKNAGTINNSIGRVGISKSEQDEINLISSYIKTQKLPTSTTVHRLEGYVPSKTGGYSFGCLDTAKLHGEYEGLSIAQVMDRINEIKDPTLKQAEYLKLRKYITSSGNECIAQNDKFMSTFLVDKLEPQVNKMIWELNLQKGTEAAFLEGVAQNNGSAYELELLLQKGSKLNIKDIVYEPKTNAWKVIADVDNKEVASIVSKDVAHTSLSETKKYQMFSKTLGKQVDVEVSRGRTSIGGYRYNFKHNGARIGYVEFTDTENGVYVDMLKNLDISQYTGTGYLADLIAVEHCLKRGLKDFEIVSEASFNSHALHYKRGKRFIDDNINKIVENIIKSTPEGQPYNTSFIGPVPMYMPKELIDKYITILSK